MTSSATKEYFAVDGSQFSRKDAEIIGPLLAELANDGELTAEDVLSVARSDNSPLRDYFEWNDATAAHQYRLEQARHMLRSIKVRVIEGGKEYEMRAFQVNYKNKQSGGKSGAYRSVSIADDAEQFAETIANALAEILSWSRRYAAYQGVWKEFGATFKEAIELMRKLPSSVDGDDAGKGLRALFDWRLKYEKTTETLATLTESLAPLFAAIKNAEALTQAAKVKRAREMLNAEDPMAELPQVVRRRCQRCGGMFETKYVAKITCDGCEQKAA